jgi:hypothetical protein
MDYDFPLALCNSLTLDSRETEKTGTTMTNTPTTKNIKRVDTLWLVLICLSLFSAWMAERANPGLISVIIMATVLAIKGRIIVDHFMELKHTHKLLRGLMRVYFYVIPILIIIVYLFPEQIAKWTTL